MVRYICVYIFNGALHSVNAPAPYKISDRTGKGGFAWLLIGLYNERVHRHLLIRFKDR